MNLLFHGSTQCAGHGKTGIRLPIAEQLATDGALVFGLSRDYEELANELHQLCSAAMIVHMSALLAALAGTFHGTERPFEPDVDEGFEDVGTTSRLLAMKPTARWFERWFGTANSNNRHTVFVARDSNVEVPAGLMNAAIAACTNLASADISGIDPNRSGRGVLTRQRLQASPEMGSLTAFLVGPVRNE
jgi:hypothetical protein